MKNAKHENRRHSRTDEDVDKNGMTEEMRGSYETFVDGMVECFKKIHAYECQQARKRNKDIRSRTTHKHSE